MTSAAALQEPEQYNTGVSGDEIGMIYLPEAPLPDIWPGACDRPVCLKCSLLAYAEWFLLFT